jgi:phosphatidylglycerophosphate synthase
MNGFQEAKRDLRGLTAGIEKRALVWLAGRMPAWVSPDHLTGLGLLAMILGGVCYALAGHRAGWLHLVNLCLVLNWFGDSLDGTLARVRQRLRPRYGFYVDHVVDAFGALFLVTGLGLSGYMSAAVAAGLLIAYYLLSISTYLATYTIGRFQMSHGIFGGTELRLLLMLGNLVALWVPELEAFGLRARFFDVVGVLGIAGITLTLLSSTARNVMELDRLERV